MKVFRKNLRLRKAIAMLLGVFTLVPCFLFSNVETVHADSTQLTSTYISLMKGAQLNDVEGLAAMSASDLRVLSIFLSNYYVPYGTSLYGDAKDTQMEAAKKSLRDLGFDKDAADQLIENVFRNSLNTARQLYVKVNADATKEFYSKFTSEELNIKGAGYNDTRTLGFNIIWGVSPSEDIFVEGTQYKISRNNTQGCVTNGKFLSNLGNSSSPVFADGTTIGGITGTDGTYTLTQYVWNCIMFDQVAIYKNHSGGNYWTDDAMVPIFDLYYKDSDGNDIKICTIDSTFKACYSHILRYSQDGAASGYLGNSFATYNVRNFIAEGGSITEPQDSTVDDWTSADMYRNTYFGRKFYVDWVGNIFVELDGNPVVVVPSCYNPAVFAPVSGNEDGYEGYRNKASVIGYYNKDVSGYASVNLKMVYKYGTASNKWAADSAPWKAWNTGAGGELWKKLWGSETFNSPAAYSIGHDKFCAVVPPNTSEGENKVATVMMFNGSYLFQNVASVKKQIKENEISCIAVYDRLGGATDANINGIIGGDVNSDLDGKQFQQLNGKWLSTDSGMNFSANVTFGSSDRKALQSFLLTYAYAYNNRITDKTLKFDFDKDTHAINMRFRDRFPCEESDLEWSVGSGNNIGEEVMNMAYYFMHPTQGLSYVATWLKNKISAIIVRWHEDIVGKTSSNNTTGMTHYLGMTGYATIPQLNDVSWIAYFLNNYNTIVVYLVLVITFVTLCSVVVGDLTVGRAITSVMVFTVLALLPPFAINTMVNIVNNTSDALYSRKFVYWAIVQTEDYIDDLITLPDSVNTSDYISYLLGVGADVNGDGSDTGFYAGVKLKWMTPKRSNEFLAEYTAYTDSLTTNTDFRMLPTILVNMSNASSDAQEFLDSDNATYLYRDLLDIYRYGYSSYHIYDVYDNSGVVTSSFNLRGTGGANKVIQLATGGDKNYANVKYSSGIPFSDVLRANRSTMGVTKYSGTSSTSAMERGFLYTIGSTTSEYYTQDHLNVSLLLRSDSAISSMQETLDRIKSDYDGSLDITNSDYYGISLGEFKFGVDELVKGSKTQSTLIDEDSLGYFLFSLYSESPYYYFNYYLRDLADTQDGYFFDVTNLTSKTDLFKKLWLSENQDYFYNMSPSAGDGYGELRDFTNMHDFFYYILPVLQVGVDCTDTFDKYYGMYMYDDVSLSFNQAAGNFVYDGSIHSDTLTGYRDFCNSVLPNLTDEQAYKVWHNYNVMSIFNTYTTWLDTMEDCSYAKPEQIKVAGNKFVVQNPLDPTTYFVEDDSGMLTEGRYMIFSRSEMKYYGLDYDDLTKVEKNIIDFQDSVYKDTLNLMNYYTFADETLIHNYALLMTFNFNKAFSENNLFGSSYTLYPQNYELKAFSYDAYLRMIIANSANEPISVSAADGYNESLYQRVLKKTSLFFGIVLLANDFVATYAVPGLRIFFILVIFFMSIMMITSSALGIQKDTGMSMMQAVWNSLIAPLGAFLLISVAMSAVVSMFMGDGASGITKSEVSISLGDPTMAVLMLLVINCLVIYGYFRIIKKCVKDLKTYSLAIVTNIGASVTGAMSKVVKLASGGMRRSFRRHDIRDGMKDALEGTGYKRNRGSITSSEGDGSTAESRGAVNNPVKSGSSGSMLGTVAAGTALGVATAGVANELSGRSNVSDAAKQSDYNAKASQPAFNTNLSNHKGVSDADKDMLRSTSNQVGRSQAQVDKYSKAADAALHSGNLGQLMEKGEHIQSLQRKNKALRENFASSVDNFKNANGVAGKFVAGMDIAKSKKAELMNYAKMVGTGASMVKNAPGAIGGAMKVGMNSLLRKGAQQNLDQNIKKFESARSKVNANLLGSMDAKQRAGVEAYMKKHGIKDAASAQERYNYEDAMSKKKMAEEQKRLSQEKQRRVEYENATAQAVARGIIAAELKKQALMKQNLANA